MLKAHVGLINFQNSEVSIIEAELEVSKVVLYLSYKFLLFED